MKAPLCTVLISFNDRGDARYDGIASAAVRAGLRPMRVAQYYSSGMILEEVVRSLCDCHMVIADLTDANHNVCYELGIAHAMGKRVLHLAEEHAVLPESLRRHRPHAFACGPADVDALAEVVKAFVELPGVYSPISFYTGERTVQGEPLLGRRFGACGVDALMLAALSAGLHALCGWDPLAVALLAIIPYFAFLSIALRSTPGQWLTGIEVIRLDRTPPFAWQAALRPVAGLLSVLTFGIGALWMVRGPRYQAVHDRLTWTLVVRRRASRAASGSGPAPELLESPAEPVAVASLASEAATGPVRSHR